MPICPSCGSANAENESLCNMCGVKLPQTAPPVQTPVAQFNGRPQQNGRRSIPPRTSPLAIVSLILAFIPCISVVGLILGIVALVQIGKDREHLTGQGLAIAGITLAVFSQIFVLIAAILFPVFAMARNKKREAGCMSNQRQIALAAMMNAQDNNEIMPMAAIVWSNVPSPHILVCPTKNSLSNGYGYNASLQKTPLININNPSEVLCAADAICTTPDNLIQTGAEIDARHNERFIASYVDGHVGTQSDIKSVRLK